jgi:hypothetical protein
MRLAVVVLLVTVGVADAEPPSKLALTAGVGVGVSHLEADTLDAGFTPGLSLRVDAAYRVTPHVAIGVHSGLARARGQQYELDEDPLPGAPPYTYDFDYTALELGVTVQLAFDRGWLAPWLGMSKLFGSDGDLESWGNTTLGYGVAAGYGVYATHAGHYVDAFVSATRSSKDNPSYAPGVTARTESFLAFTFGVDFRY